jgi:hypothetical protein
VRFYVDADRDGAFAGSVTGGVVVNIAFLDFQMKRNVGTPLRDSWIHFYRNWPGE